MSSPIATYQDARGVDVVVVPGGSGARREIENPATVRWLTETCAKASTAAALFRDAPANVSDLHALLLEELQDIKQQIGFSNTDIYKRFWNEDSHGRIETPNPEESCRDVLVDMFRERLRPLGATVEPEGHMVADKRTDIWVSLPGQKVLVELKRDYHPDVWTAAEDQLERFYTRDPEASGFGVYGVFWFGAETRKQHTGSAKRSSAPTKGKGNGRRAALDIARKKRAKIAILVFDVNEPFPRG